MYMLWTALAILAALGAAAGLYEMDYSPRGVPALKAIDKRFKLPDARFHYGAEELFATLSGLDAAGRARLLRLWRVDYAFIACLLGVMLAAGHNIAQGTVFRDVLHICATARAALDVAENALLGAVTRAYPGRRRAKAAAVAGYVTSLKYIALGAWLAAMFLCLGLRALGILG